VFHNTQPKDLYTIKNIVIFKNRKVKGKTTTKKFPQTKKLFLKKGGKQMEEITYKGEHGIFMTHEERNDLFSLIKKQSNLVKQAMQKSEETIRECKNELAK
jgi:hypothetical protein